MSRPEINAGEVKIDLGDTTITLVPTVQAAIALTSGEGGLSRINTRVGSLDFTAIRDVIVAGIGGKGSKDLDEIIFTTGMLALFTPCLNFLQLLANGGKPFIEVVEDEGKAPLVKSSR